MYFTLLEDLHEIYQQTKEKKANAYIFSFISCKIAKYWHFDWIFFASRAMNVYIG